jgi:hypothetical protein
MPRTHLNPRPFLKARYTQKKAAQESQVEAYVGEEAQKWDALNSALVSFMYLHWLETGAPDYVSQVAFRNAVKAGHILADPELRNLFSRASGPPSSTPPSALLSGSLEGE